MCLLDLKNLTFSVPFFYQISHPSSVYHFWKKSTQSWPNWMLLHLFAQNTESNLCNLGAFVSDENPPMAIPNFPKKRPKGGPIGIIRIPCQGENPPPPPRFRYPNLFCLFVCLVFFRFYAKLLNDWVTKSRLSLSACCKLTPLHVAMPLALSYT